MNSYEPIWQFFKQLFQTFWHHPIWLLLYDFKQD